MDRRRRMFAATAVTVAIFLAVQLGALALVGPFDTAGMQAFDNPEDPTNSLLYIGLILIATVLMLGAFRFGGDQVVRVVIILTAGLLSWYVFLVVFAGTPAIAGVPILSLLASGLVVVGLFFYPEWWVIDASGVVMGAGAAGLFGISFGILPALLLLVVLAVYDAISVYGTEHMLTLAEGVMDMKVPVLLIIPTTRSFSFLDAPDDRSERDPAAAVNGGDPAPEGGHPDGDDFDSGPLERDALFIGLGDAVIPTVLVASAARFTDAPALLSGFALNLPALGAIVGTTLGLLGLLWMVFKGRAHAGLPLLNGGAISGYLVGAVAAGVPLATALGL